MKKWKIYSIIVSVVLVLTILGICLYMFVFRETISEAEAQDIAYRYAGVSSSEVTVLTIQKDREDREYEIKFYDDLYEYEVDVNYNSGRIVNFEKDLRNNVNSNQGGNNSNINVSMTEEEARNIALQRVGKNSNEVTFTRVRIDRENGITVYDVYFYDNEKEYEISIDVETKEIVSFKEDYLSNYNNTTTTNDYIGVDKAREIVLNHAGLDSSDVRFSKVELDIDYHIATYEIEFYHDYYEYDYEIDAVTGEILKYERGR